MNENDLAGPWWRHISLYWAFWMVACVCLGIFFGLTAGWLYAIPAGIEALAFAILTVVPR